MSRTVLVIRRESADLPDPQPFPGSGDPVVGDETSDTPSLVVLFDHDLRPPVDSEKGNPWKNLFGITYVLDAVSSARPTDKTTKRVAVKQLLAKAAKDGKPVYVLLATYTLASPTATTWSTPASPRAIIQINLLNAQNEPVKPKTAFALLHAPRLGKSPPPPDPDTYRLAGFGRLDDDFSSVSATRFEGNKDIVAWARVANLQTLDRRNASLPRTGSADLPAGSAFDYDVVFYGPGGELLPTAAAPSI